MVTVDEMPICVCAMCRNPWGASSSPARCPHCGQASFAIADYRAKVSAAMKKTWQDPEYRAKQVAVRKGKHPTAETKAKISAALKRWHNKRGMSYV